jgi:hypothetical protein
MNEFRHDKDFIAVIKQIIKSKEDFERALLETMAFTHSGPRPRLRPITEEEEISPFQWRLRNLW